jgi:hypothetical protein
LLNGCNLNQEMRYTPSQTRDVSVDDILLVENVSTTSRSSIILYRLMCTVILRSYWKIVIDYRQMASHAIVVHANVAVTCSGSTV